MSGRKTWWSLLKDEKSDREKEEEFRDYTVEDAEDWEISDPEDLLEGKEDEKAGLSIEGSATGHDLLDAFNKIKKQHEGEMKKKREKILDDLSSPETSPEDYDKSIKELEALDYQEKYLEKQGDRISGTEGDVKQTEMELFERDNFLAPDEKEIERTLGAIGEAYRSGENSMHSQLQDMLYAAFLLKAGDIGHVLDDEGMRYDWRDPKQQLRNYLKRVHRLFKHETTTDAFGKQTTDLVRRDNLEDDFFNREIEKLNSERKAAKTVLRYIASQLPEGIDEDYIIREMTRIIPRHLSDPKVARVLGTEADEFDELDYYDSLRALNQQRRMNRDNPQALAGIDAEIERLQRTGVEEAESRAEAAQEFQIRNHMVIALSKAIREIDSVIIKPAMAFEEHQKKIREKERFENILADGNLPNRFGVSSPEEAGGLYGGLLSYPPQIFDLSHFMPGGYLHPDRLLGGTNTTVPTTGQAGWTPLRSGGSLDDMKRDLGLGDSFDNSHFVRELRQICEMEPESDTDDSKRRGLLRELLSHITYFDESGYPRFNQHLMMGLQSAWNNRDNGCSCGVCNEGDPSSLIASNESHFPMSHPRYDSVGLESIGARTSMDAVAMRHLKDMYDAKMDFEEVKAELREMRQYQRELQDTDDNEELAWCHNRIEQLARQLDSSWSLESHAEDLDLDGMSGVYKKFATPDSDDLYEVSDKLFDVTGPFASQFVSGSAMVRPAVRMPFGDDEKRMQSVFSTLPEGEETPGWFTRDTSSHDYNDRIAELEYRLFYGLGVSKLKAADWERVCGNEKMGQWLEGQDDLNARTEKMMEAILDCVPEYDYETGEDIYDYFHGTGELQLNENFISWKYGQKMQLLASEIGIEPEELHKILEDDSDTGVLNQHIAATSILKSLSRLTINEPSVSGEEWSSLKVQDEGKSPMRDKREDWPEFLTREILQTAYAKDEDKKVRLGEAEDRWDPRKKEVRRVRQKLRKVVGGKGPLFQEDKLAEGTKPKIGISDFRDRVSVLSGDRKPQQQEKWDYDERVFKDEFGRVLPNPPHLVLDSRGNIEGHVLDSEAIEKIIANTYEHIGGLNQRMENLFGTPTASSIGHVQPYEFFPLASCVLQYGMPHHIDANESLSDTEKDTIKSQLNLVMKGQPAHALMALAAGKTIDDLAAMGWLDGEHMKNPGIVMDIAKMCWGRTSMINGRKLDIDPFEEVDGPGGVTTARYNTWGFQQDEAMHQHFEQILYDSLDSIINRETRARRMRAMFGVHLGEDGEFYYSSGTQGAANATGGKTRCSGPVGVSCGGQGYVTFDQIQHLLRLQGDIAPGSTDSDIAGIVQQSLHDGNLRHYGDSDTWQKQAALEAKFKGIPSANVGVVNLRYECPYCSGLGVCGSCEGENIANVPPELESSFLSMIEPVMQKHRQNEYAVVASQLPGVDARPRLGQSLTSYLEEQGLNEILVDDVDLDDYAQAWLQEEQTEKGLARLREPEPVKSTADPTRSIRDARAAVASTNVKKYTKTISDDARRERFFLANPDKAQRDKDINQIRSTLNDMREAQRAYTRLKRAQELRLGEGKDRDEKLEEEMKRIEDNDMRRLSVMPGNIQEVMSNLNKALDLINSGSIRGIPEWRARMQHRVEKEAAARRMRDSNIVPYGKYRRYADQRATLSNDFRWKRSDARPYVWKSGVAGYLTPPWDESTDHALLQGERVFKLMALMEELRTLEMHNPSDAYDTNKWKASIRKANLETQAFINKRMEELKEYQTDEFMESITDPDEHWWRAQLRSDFIVEGVKEQISLLQEIMKQRAVPVSKAAYEKLLNNPNNEYLTEPEAWDFARQSLLDRVKGIIIATSPDSEDIARTIDWQMGMPTDFASLEKLITAEMEDMHEFHKEAPFDYDTEIREMVQRSKQSRDILNDPNSTEEAREAAMAYLDTCRYSVIDVTGPHTLVHEDEENPLTGKKFMDDMILDENWVYPRMGNASLMDMTSGKFASKLGIEHPLRSRKGKESKKKIQQLEAVLSKQEWLAGMQDRMEQLIAPIRTLAEQEGVTMQDIAIKAHHSQEGPDWLTEKLSELNEIDKPTIDSDGNITTEKVPWNYEGLFDILENRPLVHRIDEYTYSPEILEEYDALSAEHTKLRNEDSIEAEHKFYEVNRQINELLSQEKTTLLSSGYSYHPSFGVQGAWGNTLMDNHGFIWDDEESPSRGILSITDDDTMYTLKSTPMSLSIGEEGENNFDDPYFTISLALGFLQGTPLANMPSKVGMGDEAAEFMSWTPPNGGILNHQQKDVTQRLMNHFKGMVRWDASDLLRMYNAGDIQLTDDQRRALEEKVAAFHHGMNLDDPSLTDPDWFAPPRNHSELELFEMQREQQRIEEERQHLENLKSVAEVFGSEEEQQEVTAKIDANRQQSQRLKSRLHLPEGLQYAVEDATPSYISSERVPRQMDTDERNETLRDVINGEQVRTSVWDPDAPVVPIGLVDDPDTGKLDDVRSEGLSPHAESLINPESARELSGDRKKYRDARTARDISGRDKEIEADLAASRGTGAFVPAGKPGATLLQEEEREKLGEGPIPLTDKNYPEYEFDEEGNAVADHPMWRREPDDDYIQSSSDDPIDFAFRILKNIV